MALVTQHTDRGRGSQTASNTRQGRGKDYKWRDVVGEEGGHSRQTTTRLDRLRITKFLAQFTKIPVVVVFLNLLSEDVAIYTERRHYTRCVHVCM